MILIIIIAIIGGIWGAINEPYEKGFGAFMGSTSGAMLGVVACLFTGIVFYSGSVDIPQRPVPLVSMADGQGGIHGSFFLGSGTIDGGNPAFTWYERNGGNSYVRRNVDASIATVHYVKDGVRPYYVETDECSKHEDLPSFTAWGFNMDKGCYEDYYDFYIPKGSIVQSYTLDNK